MRKVETLATLTIALASIGLLSPAAAPADQLCSLVEEPAAPPGSEPGAPDEVPPATGDELLFSAAECSATAHCGTHPDVSCTGTSTCQAVDRLCVFGSFGQWGYVKCDGVTTPCAKDSACIDQCDAEFDACKRTCTTFFPCVEDCVNARDYCRCLC